MRVVDFETAGANRFAFERYYNARHVRPGHYALGAGWTHSYSGYLVFEGGNLSTPAWVDAYRANGRVLRFTRDATSGLYTAPAGEISTLALSGTEWLLGDGDRVVEAYTGGQLSRIEHANGYQITLAYTGSAGTTLSTVTDSHGRQLSSTIGDVDTKNASQRWRFTRMNAGPGLDVDYAYADPAPRYFNLIKVTHPAVDVGGVPVRHTTLYDYDDPSVPAGGAQAPFLLTGITDENGVGFATYHYDHLTRRALLSTHALGDGQVTVAYDDVNGVITTTNALGKQAAYRYSAIGGQDRVTAVDGLASTNCAAATRAQGYDADGFVASTTDAEGNVRELNGLDARGLPGEVVEKDAAGTVLRRASYVWHADFRLPELITIHDGAGNPIRSIDPVYDAVTGNMTARTETDLTALAGAGAPGVRTWSYTYDATGRMTAMDGPLPGADDTTTYGYTGAYLTSVTLPAVNGVAPVWAFAAHDGYGQPRTVTDPNGLVTALAYDGRGRLVSHTVQSAQGDAVTTFDYDPRGLLAVLTTPLGGVYSYSYDAARRLTAVEDGTGNRMSYPNLDAMGNVNETRSEDAVATLKRQQEATFDELGRLLTVLEAGDPARTSNYGYDLNDVLTSVTDALGNETRFVHDGLRRVAKMIDASNAASDPACGTAGVTCMAYDVFDNPVAVTDGRGNATVYARNGFSEVIERTSPDSAMSLFEYDAMGRVVSRATADGRTTVWTRDARGRIETAVTTDDGGSGGGGGGGGGGSGTASCTVVPLLGLSLICDGGASGDPGDPPPPTGSSHVVSYAWDTGANGIGRLASITEPAGVTTYSYDDRGNVVSESRDIGTVGTPYVTSYAWDLADNLVRIVWPTGEAVDYVRDTLGRITTVDFTATPGGTAAAVASAIQYDPFGPETSSTLTLDGVQLASTRTFGLDGRLDRTELTQGGSVLHDLSISHDDAGRVDGRTDAVTPALDESFTSGDLCHPALTLHLQSRDAIIGNF